MTANAEMFGPTALAVTQGVTAFSIFLPKISEVRRNTPEHNPDFAADVRMGEVAAATLTLGIGAIASSLTGSPLPAIVGVITTFVLVAIYESTLRADRPLERTVPFTQPTPIRGVGLEGA